MPLCRRWSDARAAAASELSAVGAAVQASDSTRPPARTTAGGESSRGGGQRVSPAVAEMVGWRRERTASMISLGSIPCRYVLVVPRSVCSELALDDVDRHSFARELDGMRVTQLMRSEPAPDPGVDGELT